MSKYTVSKIIFVALFSALLVLWYRGALAIYVPVLAAAVYCALLAVSSFNVGSQFYVKSVCRGSVQRKEISLTFDDGPLEKFTPQILDILRSYGVSGTFFCPGKSIAARPEIARRMDAEGHIIGNHTWSHAPMFDLYTSRRMRRELTDTADVIEKTIGKKPLFFRPPYGVTNPPLARALSGLNYQVIGWSFRTYDTVISDRKKLLDRVLSGIHNGSIVTFHDYNEMVVEILPELIDSVRGKGFSIVSLSQLIGRNAYV